jgi:hypothetical protein
MKVINSRGRVLLEVTKAVDCNHAILYAYRGDGRGGYVDAVQLAHTINYIKMDHPSAKVIGELPKPEA